MKPSRSLGAAILAASVVFAACGSEEDTSSSATDTQAQTAQDDNAAAGAENSPGIRRVTAAEGAAIQAAPPEDLVILDVRTPGEFAAGHLEGAMVIDFYDDDFADQLAELDPNVPYLMYCQSGNRSGQAAAVMAQLGFTDVADIDGGIASWANAGLPVVAG